MISPLMRRLAVLAGIAAVVTGTEVRTADADQRPCVIRARVGGVITAGTAAYLDAAVEAAAARRCTAVLVVVDTPGGSLAATRRIVATFLDAPVPIITYVAPSQARAGAAGMFLTMSAHVAAMSPGTRLGAEPPEAGLAAAIGGDRDQHLDADVVGETAAFAGAVARQRDRNPSWAEAAVRAPLAATNREALALGAVDRIAGAERDLLEAVHGTLVEVRGEPTRVETSAAVIEPFAMSLRQRVRSFVSNPSVTFLLALIGILGILIELFNPGLLLPGLAGVTSLVLAAIGYETLPVEAGAVGLLALAVVLLAAELFVTGYGVLALGGLAAMLVGATLFIDQSAEDFFADASVRMSWGAVVPLAIMIAAAAAAMGWRGSQLQRHTAEDRVRPKVLEKRPSLR